MHSDREALVALLQEYAGEAERLSQIVADRHDLHVTDLSALLAVMQADRAGTSVTRPTGWAGRSSDRWGAGWTPC